MTQEILSKEIRDSASKAVAELVSLGRLSQGDILVVGCSSSEMVGEKIGKCSAYFAAEALVEAIYPILSEKGIFLAAQCCEHLNRALVIERACAEKYSLEEVSVIPQPKAGGSFATAVYAKMDSPVVVEHIRAHAGIDIGGTLIGMHLRDVAVPARLSLARIGQAPMICAYTRPKYIGGERARYTI